MVAGQRSISLILDNPLRGQPPAAECPREPAMPDLPGERRRRNGKHRALGMTQAVAGNPAGGHPSQGAATASTNDEHVTGAPGETDQHPAGRPAL